MAELVEVKVKVPRKLAMLMKPRRLENELKLLAALELYREGRLSLGRAAEIAGLSLREFLYEMRVRGVSLNYDLEELGEDLKTVNEFLSRRGRH